MTGPTESEGWRLAGAGLVKAYGARVVVSDVSILVRPREITGLLGPSGSGKTTIFRMLTGLERPDRGLVSLDGRDVSRVALDGRARLGLGYVPQAPSLFPGLTAEENLKIAAEARHTDPALRKRVVGMMLAWFGIEPTRNVRLGLLSGGQRKLVEIAYAVCPLPRYLLLDEPFTGLDPLMVAALSARIRAIAASGVGVLLTDHKARAALELVDSAVVLQDGRVIAAGPPADVIDMPRVRSAFLGDNFSVGEAAPAEGAMAV
ncbi:hypothetical protein SLNSH_04260 [Alsobacter soli]|uniref:Lipopolysaccharide export system ATP-binding protein LptB n=1 Tax=Alsobacter soli TaxID=2109933 RepID=A0A2T1HXS9_9HYPH|nr:ATP-binding cassette domain-containing protein [Alsobacter soli]PSC06497.1 hypothetical protein SLNSH_04260 [Alsobacter soli]